MSHLVFDAKTVSQPGSTLEKHFVWNALKTSRVCPRGYVASAKRLPDLLRKSRCQKLLSLFGRRVCRSVFKLEPTLLYQREYTYRVLKRTSRKGSLLDPICGLVVTASPHGKPSDNSSRVREGVSWVSEVNPVVFS